MYVWRKIRSQTEARIFFSGNIFYLPGCGGRREPRKSFLQPFVDERVVCHVKDVVHVTGPTGEEPNQVDDGAEMICAGSMIMAVAIVKSTLLQSAFVYSLETKIIKIFLCLDT